MERRAAAARTAGPNFPGVCACDRIARLQRIEQTAAPRAPPWPKSRQRARFRKQVAGQFLVALARYGAVRTPGETLAIKWEHVDWEHARLSAPSPKTERHPGSAERVISLFPELRPFLEECCELAQPSVRHLSTRYRHAGVNLRTQRLRIIRRVG